MPCDSSHCEPHKLEVEISRVAALVDHVFSGKSLNREHFNGQHPCVYNQHPVAIRKYGDAMTALLCWWCNTHGVERECWQLQAWWIEHLKADEKKMKNGSSIKAAGSSDPLVGVNPDGGQL